MSKRWTNVDGVHLNLTGLEAPQPMLAVMTEINASDAPLTLHMDREPIFLYPELQEMGWVWTVQATDNPGAGEAAFVIHLKKTASA